MNKFNIVLAAVVGVLVGFGVAFFIVGGQRRARQIAVDYQDWNKLNVILGEIEANYVDTIDIRSMTDAAVTAALNELDPHSVYLPPVVLEASETELSGNFEGIGLQFNVPNDTAVVLNVIQGGPSERVGIITGDKLIRVDGKDIAGVNMPQDSMVAKMRGPSGSKVCVTVLRDGVEIPFDITRDKIPVNSIDAAFMLDETTGYIRLAKFSRSTYIEFQRAALILLAQGMERLIFDLRDNGGGYMEPAVMICNDFLSKGDMIVYFYGLHRDRQEYKADGTGAFQNIGLTVLINESSASASEIVAGAIQDNDRGMVIGRRSFGKGLVQEPIYFNDGSGIRLTVSRYYSPSGRCIQKPYDDYQYDLAERYKHGEMTNADSISVDRSAEYFTAGGRIVYGGGGIVPDIFVPIDTTRATNFYVECNRKTMPMRFAAAVLDKDRERLSEIDSFDGLEAYFAGFNMKKEYLAFAAANGVVPEEGEWEESESYLVPQLKALIARYSKMGEEAFYRYYMDIDDGIKIAMENSSVVVIGE